MVRLTKIACVLLAPAVAALIAGMGALLLQGRGAA
jgi:hypothetical protein